MDVHEMQVTSHDRVGVVLECEDCDRIVAVGADGEFESIVKGNQLARHVGGLFDTVISVNVGPAA